jgi:hypothetical protein
MRRVRAKYPGRKREKKIAYVHRDLAGARHARCRALPRLLKSATITSLEEGVWRVFPGEWGRALIRGENRRGRIGMKANDTTVMAGPG